MKYSQQACSDVNKHNKEKLDIGHGLVTLDEGALCGVTNVGQYLMQVMQDMPAFLRAVPGSDQFDSGDPMEWGVGSVLAHNPLMRRFPKREKVTDQ